MKIVFRVANGVESIPKEYLPYPSSAKIPEWYKKTEKNISGIESFSTTAGTSRTIRSCMPVTDTLTAGYIIPTQADLFVVQKEVSGKPGETEPYFHWSSTQIDIKNQTIPQAPYHPMKGDKDTYYPKIVSPYTIKTPSGYSCLFLPPMNNDNGIFSAIPGIVDTDTYDLPVNFPFVFHDSKFTGVIPAGTPIVQVIPFKRDSWKQEFEDENGQAIKQINLLNSKIFDKYKHFIWNRKEFK